MRYEKPKMEIELFEFGAEGYSIVTTSSLEFKEGEGEDIGNIIDF